MAIHLLMENGNLSSKLSNNSMFVALVGEFSLDFHVLANLLVNQFVFWWLLLISQGK